MNQKTVWTDTQGRVWRAHVSIGTAERLRAEGIDLLDPKQLGTIYQDPFQLVRLNAAIHREQWEELGLSEGDFLALSTDDEYAARESIAAMEAGLADFFHRMRRESLAAVLTAASDAARETDRRQVAKLQTERARQAIDAEIARALKPLDDALEKSIAGNTSGSSPAS